MRVIRARNVNDALRVGTGLLLTEGVARDSRNGQVLVLPEPVTTVYQHPWERVLLNPVRDANPFFHLYEALWMLSGSDNVLEVAAFAKNMLNYSDDGRTLHGAYGRRWRGWFKFDQIKWAARRLRADPDDRRVVIGMWDPRADALKADAGGRDVPCNTTVMPWVDVDGRLSMTVTCRSNDIVWGAYGANAVHFSVLQEVLAHLVGVPVGRLYQVSNNFHAYLATLDERWLEDAGDPYDKGEVSHRPMFQPSEEFTWADLAIQIGMWMKEPWNTTAPRWWWLKRVATPVVCAHLLYRHRKNPDRFDRAMEVLEQCHSPDWRRACTEWLQRRETKLKREADDGVTHDA